MSHTDHARPRRRPSHRTRVAHVRLYGGRTADQSVCSCGAVGPHRDAWHEANNDSRDHHRAIADEAREAITEGVRA